MMLEQLGVSKKALLAGVAVAAVALTIFDGYYTVAPYERAVVTRAGALHETAGPGLHFKLPFVDVVTRLPADTRQLQTAPLNTYTIDNQEVEATVVVQYAIPGTELPFIYANVGQSIADIEAKLASMVIDRWKIEAGRVNVAQIAENRGDLTAKVMAVVKEQAKTLYHLAIVDVQVPNIEFGQSFREAQANAAVVKAQIEQSASIQRKSAIEADTKKIEATGEANRQIEAARGRAESQLIEAQKAAQATVLAADAEAKAIAAKGTAQAGAQEALAKALAVNPALVQLTQAQRWDGKLPTAMYAGAPLPLMSIGK